MNCELLKFRKFLTCKFQLVRLNIMSQFIRPVDKHVEDLLVLDIEALRHLSDELNHHIPDFLCDGELDAVRHHVLEETADSLIVGESPCRRKQVVLHGCYHSHGYLRGEVAHLVLAESEILLAVLEYDLQRPSHGIDLIGLKEGEFLIRTQVFILVIYDDGLAWLGDVTNLIFLSPLTLG